METNRFFLGGMLILFTVSLIIPADALRNPSAVYCQSLGYTYVTRDTPDGSVGSCQISGSVECSAWDFLWGKCGTDYSYCVKQGLSQRSGKGSECGVDNKNAECLVCILPDGRIREVSDLMNLSVREGVCGDGACVIGEDYQNCPKDCPAGPKTVKYRYWDDLGNETTTTVATNDNGHVSTTIPANNAGSSASSFYIIVIVLVLLIILFIGLGKLRNRGKE
jgi:putative hemolysin